MAHVQGKGAGGSDTLDNVRVLCREHHMDFEHNAQGKPIPRKPR